MAGSKKTPKNYHGYEDNFEYYFIEGEALQALEKYPHQNPKDKDIKSLLTALNMAGDDMAVQVFKTPNTHARAYQVPCELFQIPAVEMGKELSVVCRVPVDYNGKVNPPKGAVKMPKDARDFARNYFAMAGGHGSAVITLNATLDLPPRTGADLPSDYSEAKSKHVNSTSAGAYEARTRYYRVPVHKVKLLDEVYKAKEQGLDLARFSFQAVLANPKTGELPRYEKMRGGAFLIYQDVNPRLKLPIDKDLDLESCKTVGKISPEFKSMVRRKEYELERTDFAEYAWFKQNDHDVEISVRPPLHVPDILDHLYEMDRNRCYVASGAALKELNELHALRDKNYADRDILAAMIYGPQTLRDYFIGAHEKTSRQMPSVNVAYAKDGRALGVQFSKKPEGWIKLNKIETLSAQENQQLIDHSMFFYKPNAKKLPDIAAHLDQMRLYPDCRDSKAVFGDKPVIEVFDFGVAQNAPEAREAWPHTRGRGHVQYITTPIGYKGDSFRPLDSFPISAYQYTMGGVGGGGWVEPDFAPYGKKVKLPADYKPQNNNPAP